MKVTGFVASSFDLIHPGYVLMLKKCKQSCNYLIVGLQIDPSIERPDTKEKPVQTIAERQIVLSAIKYVDEIVVYETEKDLEDLLRAIRPNYRFVGCDYENREDEITGYQYSCVKFIDRDHDWSTTALKKRIRNV